MDIYEVVKFSGRAVLLAVIYFVLLVLGVILFAQFIFNLSWLQGLMLGTVLSGTSAVVIIPLMTELKVDKQIALTLSLESVMDNFYIVVFFAALEAHLGQFPGFQDAFSAIASKFSVGMFLGFVVGVFWIKVLYVIRRERYTYMLSMAVLILMCVVSEALGGSGVLASLIFGLVLGNIKNITRITRMEMDSKALDRLMRFLKRFQGEISFLIRSFFFVYLGLIYEVSGMSWLAAVFSGLALTIMNIFLRYLAVYIATFGSSMASKRGLMTLMCGKGLSSAVLSVVPLQYPLQFPNALIYTTSAVNIILLTNIVTSLSAFWMKKSKLP